MRGRIWIPPAALAAGLLLLGYLAPKGPVLPVSSGSIDSGSNVARIVSDEQLAVVCIAQEAIGEPLIGKQAVAEVLLRRTRHKFRSDGTMADTIFRPFQFSGMNTRDPGRVRSFRIDDDDPHVKDCLTAYRLALAGSNVSKDADSYANLHIVVPVWATAENTVATIGNHTFFRLRK